jgi:predicted alpha/beta-fold hydrolase
VVRSAAALLARGYHVIRLNLRGAGESVREARQLYHGGLTEDLHLTAAQLAADPRVRGLALLGFSLGGNASLKAAAEQVGPGPVKAVVAVSAPLDLIGASRNLGLLRNLPYGLFILRSLLTQARLFADLHPQGLTYTRNDLLRIRTVWDYDDVVVGPMHGFGNAQRYYEASSAGPKLGRIAIPGLLIHAADDPMVPGPTVEPHLRPLPPNLELAWTEQGGHVGFFGGLHPGDWRETWAVTQAAEFLQRVLPPAP